MIEALAADAVAAGLEATVFVGSRAALNLPWCQVVSIANRSALWDAIAEHAPRADWTLAVAPETAGCLAQLIDAVRRAGGRSLASSSETIELAGDKFRMAGWLRQRGVAAPQSVLLEPGGAVPRDFCYPAIVKPRDGAGAIGVYRIDSVSDSKRLLPEAAERVLEPYYPGTAASVAVLCGPQGVVPLEPCTQCVFDDRGVFEYRGGSLPLLAELACRARHLARNASACLPDALGYVGVDLVLGNRPSGADDVVIEINPRVTTSYVALRRVCRTNLIAAMIDVAEGRTVELQFEQRPLEFDVSGRVQELPEQQPTTR
jgi:predicted ATP-grasp superfamily ATP-dependent carboligase